MNPLDKLISEEKKFFDSEFVSPVVSNSPVGVSIDGVIFYMKILPNRYRGWGIFKPINARNARFVREASVRERQAFVGNLPKLSLMITDVEAKMGTIAINDGRFSLSANVPIYLMEDCSIFDVVNVAYNGRIFIYVEHNRRFSPALIRKLREYLNNNVKVENFDDNIGLTTDIKSAYETVLERKLAAIREQEKLSFDSQLHNTAANRGASVVNYVKRGASYTVEYRVNGRTYHTVIDENMQVENAGFCVSGRDRDFDFGSLISILKEGQRRGVIYNYDTYSYEDENYD